MNDSAQHPEDLLPWYVNGSLSAAEQQRVEAHLQECGTCRAEVELLRAMRDVSKQVTEPVPGQFAWQRLQRDIRQQDKTVTKRQWWVPSLAAAALLVIAIQGVLLFNVTRQDGYGLAGHAPPGTVVQVKFNPEATEKSIRAALQGVGGEIVTGPSAAGIYHIQLADSADDPELQARIERLQAQRDVIDYLQRD